MDVFYCVICYIYWILCVWCTRSFTLSLPDGQAHPRICTSIQPWKKLRDHSSWCGNFDPVPVELQQKQSTEMTKPLNSNVKERMQRCIQILENTCKNISISIRMNLFSVQYFRSANIATYLLFWQFCVSIFCNIFIWNLREMLWLVHKMEQKWQCYLGYMHTSAFLFEKAYFSVLAFTKTAF